MKGFFLYYLLRMFTGNPLAAIIGVLLIYTIVDKAYLGFLPDFTKGFRKKRQIKNSLMELNVNPENAQAAFVLGEYYFEKKKYEKALKYLSHHKLQKDESAKYYHYLGMTLMELGKTEEGKKYIEKALELNPRVGYGLPYIYLIDDEMKRHTPNKNKINAWEEEVERFGNTENLYKLGMIYKKQGDKETAKKLFSKVLIEYDYCPKGIRRIHRKWAILARVGKAI